MGTLDAQFEKDAEVLNVDDSGIKGISDLSKKAKSLSQELSDLEDIVKEKKKEYRKLTEEIIPEALAELGMSSFTMNDGSSIEVKRFYSASIPKGREAECFEYLRQRGLDDIIKNQVSVGFGRGEDELAGRLKSVLSEQNFMFVEKQSVHPKTLEATLREQVELGNEFDLQLFNGFIGQRAVIKT